MTNQTLITQRIRESWLGFLPFAVQDLLKKYPDMANNEIDEIPDEDFRILPDGSGEIFVTVRDQELKLKVPQSEWAHAYTSEELIGYLKKESHRKVLNWSGIEKTYTINPSRIRHVVYNKYLSFTEEECAKLSFMLKDLQLL